MAVYVLLTFDKDDDAKKFVGSVLEEKTAFVQEGNFCENGFEVPASVRGVWKKPTLFCECESRDKKRGFTRGKKYGWWVCVKCGKPSWRWAQGNAWFTALGTNLLPQSQVAPEYRPPGGDPKVLWSFLPDELLNTDPLAEWVFKNDPKTGTTEITKVPKL